MNNKKTVSAFYIKNTGYENEVIEGYMRKKSPNVFFSMTFRKHLWQKRYFIFNRTNGRLTYYKHKPSNPNEGLLGSIPIDRITSFVPIKSKRTSF